MNRDVTTGLGELAPLAEQLHISVDELADVLMLYPVGKYLTEHPIATDLLLSDAGLKIVNQIEDGADPNEVEGANDLAERAAALTIDNYFRNVAEHSEDYLEELRGDVTDLSKDIKPGEGLTECVRRNLKNYDLVVTISPAATTVFPNDFAPILNNVVINEIAGLNKKLFKQDHLNKTATYTSPKGTKFTIKNFDKLTANLSPSAAKIFYAALAELTTSNIHRTPVRQATVEIPLLEYGEACGKKLHADIMPTDEEQTRENARVADRIKDFKKQVRKDLNAIKSIEISREETRGYIRGDYHDMNIISSHGIRTTPSGPVIEVNFDVRAAQYFNDSYVSWFPTALFRADNRNPNEFSIGCKIAMQNSIDNNVAKGTDNTISVRALLETAPDIVTNLDELKTDRNRYDWKTQIKKPLERSLNGLVKIGYLENWNYRNGETGKTYTPSAAARLSWNTYHKLRVDFCILPDNPGREHRTSERLKAQNKRRRGVFDVE